MFCCFGCVRLDAWKPGGKSCAEAGRAFHHNTASVSLGDFFDNCQPQPGSRKLGILYAFAAIESLKNRVNFIGGDTDPRILDNHKCQLKQFH